MFELLDARKREFDARGPFSADVEHRLDRVFKPFFIYSSNALEGSTLSLGDTIYILEERRLPGGKRESEYLEVIGQEEAYRYLQQAVAEKYELSEKLICEFHKLLTDRLGDNYGPGKYKTRDNSVQLGDGTVFSYVSHVDVPAAMRALVDWVRGPGAAVHPVERAARLHYQFILIHPFLDGNGRTARILANLVLLQAGYVPAFLRADERRRVYLDALRAVDTSVAPELLAPSAEGLNLFPLVSYIEEELLWSYDKGFDVLDGRTGITAADLVAKVSGLDEKARQLVPATETERARERQAAVETLVERIARITDDFAAAANENATSVAVDVTQPVLRAAPDVLPRMFGASGLSHVQDLAVVEVKILRREDALPGVFVAANNCTFYAGAEPHRIVMGCQPTAALESFATLTLPVSPTQWRAFEIEQFVVDQLARLLDSIVITKS